MTDSRQLLADYVKGGSEPAFHELVQRYLDLVYSVAIRLTQGDRQLAEDVSQHVFIDLARKAGSLPSDVMLGGWLHRHTCFVASTLLRGERRRRLREREVVEMNALQDHPDASLAIVTPVLDEAINQLRTEDRTAIVLRFFEQRDFRSIGQALGSNEDAAQKRVSRALDKLAVLLKDRGITASAVGLGTMLSTQAVATAPGGLALTISTAALTGAAAGAGSTFTIFKFMTMTKLQIGIISAIAVVGVSTPLILQQREQMRLREETDQLRRQMNELEGLKGENERLSRLVAQSQETAGLNSEQQNELLRLRSEVSTLRAKTGELNRTGGQTRPASNSASTATAPAPETPEEQTAGASFPRENWAYSGYSTPEAAAQTMAWAALNGDLQVITNSVTPELKQRLDMLMQQGRFESDFLAPMTADVNSISAFRIVEQELLADDQIRLHVAIPGKKNQRMPILKKVGDEWKFLSFN